MTLTRRYLTKAFFTALFATTLAPQTFAQSDFPQKAVTLVVPFAAGGGLDVTARILAEKLKDVLGQPVVIANRPGAGSSVGARAVAAAPADGYTLFITSGSAFAYQHLLVPSYDLELKDFAPVAVVASNPSVIVTSTQLPAKSLQELVEYAQANPGKVSFCSTGSGGLNHLQLEMFKRVAKAKTGKDFNVTHVPYNGLAPALVGVRDQSVQACTLPYTALVKNLDGKELRVLAVQTEKRLPWLPNVRTTGEQGYKELDANEAFVNVVAPKGTPQPVLAKLEGAFRQAMQDPAVRKKLEDLEVQPMFMDSRQTRQWLEEDVKRFSVVIREAGLATSK
ncbi:MAG TPA: tripartite tricarboxylate transporter substrate binding protein [Ramlibacter sp.]|nr:tripartite tricarboxylate transporter substrate binding protein [Ramlibacter sp.]